MAKLNISQNTTDLIVTSVLNLLVAEIPEIVKYFAARAEVVTEADARAKLEAAGVTLIARNEAWLIMKGALTVADEGAPDPS